MTLEEFKRPYTKAELKSLFDSNGFDAVLWQYCKESNDEIYSDYEKDYGYPEDGETIEDFIKLLQEEQNWTATSIREEVWLYAMSPERVEAYMSQVRVGHGHQWAKIYTDKIIFDYEDPIKETFDELFSQNPTEANQELNIYIENLSQGNNPIFKKAFREFACDYDSVKDIEDFANGVVYQYNKLVNSCCKSNEIYEHAYNLAYEDRDEVYYNAYNIAIKNGCSAVDSYNFADTIEEHFLNDYLILELKSFAKKFNELWQREYYYKLIEEYWKKNDECISSFMKTEIRKELGLPQIEAH